MRRSLRVILANRDRLGHQPWPDVAVRDLLYELGRKANLRVIERLTRPDANTLMYEFTIDDPTAFSSPWTARFPMMRSTEQMYEYACHEGNFGLLDILKGARYDDQVGNPGKK